MTIFWLVFEWFADFSNGLAALWRSAELALNAERSPSLGVNLWIPLGAALAGGVISLLGSFGATWLGNKLERNNQIAAREKLEAERAYVTFYKLMDGYNAVGNLKNHIDGMFYEADRNGAEDFEPWAKVMAIIGAEEDIERILPGETSFLIGAGNANLLNDVHLIQKRIANDFASAAKYNELRGELQTLLEASAARSQVTDGAVVSAEFDEEEGVRMALREGQLNSLLGQIMEALEDDVPQSWRILEEFKAAAKRRFGQNFQDFNAEKIETPQRSYSSSRSNAYLRGNFP